jgi:aerobic-type carbon monoxide dehydrogenase small subunit (CoxS/CutS family)
MNATKHYPRAVTTRTLLHRGQPHALVGDGHVLEALRSALGVTSLARGCSTGLCGACRVLVDGAPVNTCTAKVVDLTDGATLELYEDLETDPASVTAVAAFTAERPTRCTLCVPSIGVTAVSLARRGLSGDADAVDDALRTAACMCTGRGSLRRALLTK